MVVMLHVTRPKIRRSADPADPRASELLEVFDKVRRHVGCENRAETVYTQLMVMFDAKMSCSKSFVGCVFRFRHCVELAVRYWSAFH